MKILPRILLLATAWAVSSAQAADERSWVERSNTNAAPLLEVLAKYGPESAAALGVEGHDEDVFDLRPGNTKRYQADLEKVAADLDAQLRVETDPRVRQDLQILVAAARDRKQTSELNRRLMLPHFDLGQALFRGFQALLDPRVPTDRYPAALVRLRKYTGREPGHAGGRHDGTVSCGPTYKSDEGPEIASLQGVLPTFARAAIGALAGAILGKLASAVVGYLLYFAMILSVWNRPVGVDSWFLAVASLPLLGWLFGALPGAVSGAATLASRKLIAILSGCLASALYALVELSGGNPAASFIAVITSIGAIIAGGLIYFASWLVASAQAGGPKAA